MFKLWATIIKDIRILTRDKVGIALMFGMPILLVLIVTSIQNSTFQLINKNKHTPFNMQPGYGENKRGVYNRLLIK